MNVLRRFLAPVLALLIALAATPSIAQDEDSGRLADESFTVSTAEGHGTALYFGTASLDGDAKMTRAIIIVHGVLRNADYYFETGLLVLHKAEARNTMLVAPQFIEAADLRKAHLDDPGLLRWGEDWPGGSDATGPARISTYDVFDAMLERLADKSRFPRMQEIVVLGHSAGGQIVQRYAVVGGAPDRIRKDVRVHLIVANPSSYLYLDDWRPQPQPGCSEYNHWRYGVNGAPRYVKGTASELEERYVRRHVTYMLGASDIDPQEWDLDRSCGGEAQGRYRFARGLHYIKHLHSRHPNGTEQDYAFVRGVPHDNRRMFTSHCGLEVIFGGSLRQCEGHGKV